MEIDTEVYGLNDKVAIVTGGGAGIGKGIVRELAKAGASVAVVPNATMQYYADF